MTTTGDIHTTTVRKRRRIRPGGTNLTLSMVSSSSSSSSSFLFCFFCWSCFLVHYGSLLMFVTAKCSVRNGFGQSMALDALPDGVLYEPESDRLQCLQPLVCSEWTIAGCALVQCKAFQSCVQANFGQQTKGVACWAKEACLDAFIMDADHVACGVNEPHACLNAEIETHQSVLCYGPKSCVSTYPQQKPPIFRVGQHAIVRCEGVVQPKRLKRPTGRDFDGDEDDSDEKKVRPEGFANIEGDIENYIGTDDEDEDEDDVKGDEDEDQYMEDDVVNRLKPKWVLSCQNIVVHVPHKSRACVSMGQYVAYTEPRCAVSCATEEECDIDTFEFRIDHEDLSIPEKSDHQNKNEQQQAIPSTP